MIASPTGQPLESLHAILIEALYVRVGVVAQPHAKTNSIWYLYQRTGLAISKKEELL